MNSPENKGNQVVNGVQLAMEALTSQQCLGVTAGEEQFLNTMPNGDPDHVMLWGDDEH